MLKKLCLDKRYEFSVDGEALFEGRHVQGADDETIELMIEGQPHRLLCGWLRLIAHYEVDLPWHQLRMISFEECKSRVLKLKCGQLMVFKRPLAAGNDFWVIPGFTRFGITREGVVKSLQSDRLLKPSIGPYGYPYVNLYDPDKGRWRSVAIHLLLARTFVPNNVPSVKLFVNHKNGNKLDPSLKNLEWVTSVGNSRHAIASGLRLDNMRCRVFDSHTGEIKEYDSVGQALSAIGSKTSRVRLAKQVNASTRPTLVAGRYELKAMHDTTPWKLSQEATRDEHRLDGPFEVKNTQDGSVVVVPYLRDVVAHTGATLSTVTNVLRSHDPKTAKGYLVRKKSNDSWPSTFAEIVFNPPRQFRATQIETGRVSTYPSLRKLCAAIGGNKQTLKLKLARKQPYLGYIVEEIV